jgi:Type ISP C-terminal specificity domain
MVERVDQALKSEFQTQKGFADEHVLVLDPCVGTGSFLLAVLRKIQENLPDDALAAQDLKKAAMERVFGFEILPAPFVVAHLQLGLLLDQLGAPLSPDGQERAAIFLTNALTGWADDEHAVLPFPELEEEREAAHTIKHDRKILVVLGNPPYFPFAGVNSVEETDLIEPYKVGIKGKNSLGDLYVRFIRVAERRIVDGTGHGIVCLITSFSYLHEPSFAQMRRVLVDEFDSITIDNLNGDSRETGKRTPAGKPDPSIFSTPMNRPGIQVGTAIGLFVRSQSHTPDDAMVRYRDFWGDDKRAQLINTLHGDSPDEGYAKVQLSPLNRYSFRSGVVSLHYPSWPKLSELAALDPFPGLLEKRAGALIDPDKSALINRMKVYLDKKLTIENLRATPAERLTRDWARFGASATRARLLASGGFDLTKIVPFLVSPLDIQWAYVDPTPKLWNEARSKTLLPNAVSGARFIIARNRAPRLDDGAPLLAASCLGEEHSLHKDAYFIPFVRQPVDTGDGLFDPTPPMPNYSARSADYLAALGVDTNHQSYADLLWWHALAVAYAPSYVAENSGGIATDWPRIPLPSTLDALAGSAQLGKLLADLLDPLRPVSPTLLSAIVAPVRRIDGRAAQPALGDLEVRARWGIGQKDGTVMPGRGKVISRPYTEAESAALSDASKASGAARDIYLNEGTCWSCVPELAWEFKIGGFQVLKKWLSYREYGDGHPGLLGRSLTTDEAREFSILARRITAIVSLKSDLDANYSAVKADIWQWYDSPAVTSGAAGED